MNKDIRLATSFKGHRKRKKLKRILGFGAEIYLIDLWLTVAMDCPEGILVGWDEEDISDACDWPGDPNELVTALIESGWLEKDSDGEYVIHDWCEHQGWACKAKQRSNTAKQAANARWGKKYGNADSMQPHSDSNTDSMQPHSDSNADSNAPSPSPSPLPSQNTPLPPKGKDVELKDFLLKNIPEDLSFLKNNFLEFFKYRQQKPKSKRYQSEIGINGLFRDICNCIAVGHPPVECLNIAMERGWQTPSPDYFKPEMFTKLTNGTVQETKEQILKRHGLSA